MIGKGTEIHKSAIIYDDIVEIGKNCRIGENVVIGIVGSEHAKRPDRSIYRKEFKGGIIIGDNVDISTGTLILRGVVNNTIIGEGTFIGAQCLISHDVNIGKHCEILNRVAIYGHSVLGDYVRIQPSTEISNRIQIGSEARIGIGSLVLHDVPKGKTAFGRPAKVEVTKGTTTKRVKARINQSRRRKPRR